LTRAIEPPAKQLSPRHLLARFLGFGVPTEDVVYRERVPCFLADELFKAFFFPDPFKVFGAFAWA
jgi:hypothetical protein